MTIAVYPGSFDPITFGHSTSSAVPRRLRQVVVGVLVNPRKSPALDAGERTEVVREAIAEIARRHCRSGRGHRLRRPDRRFRRPGSGPVRSCAGLRAMSDFEVELQMAHTNRKLAPAIDTVFFMTALEHAYLSVEPGQARSRRSAGTCRHGPPRCGTARGSGTGVRPYNRPLGAPAPSRASGILIPAIALGGDSHRHHLPHRTLEGPDRQRPQHAAHEQRRRGPGRRARSLDQLRVAVPEEVRQAKRINEETSRIVERAQEEAERILARAQEQAAFLIEERELTRAAEIKSQQIIEDGRPRPTRSGAARTRTPPACWSSSRASRQGAPEHPARPVDARRAPPGGAGPGVPGQPFPPAGAQAYPHRRPGIPQAGYAPQAGMPPGSSGPAGYPASAMSGGQQPPVQGGRPPAPDPRARA